MLGIPQPCRDGLVCNNDVCQTPCAVGGPADQCPDDGRCADASAALGVEAGLCAPLGCNFFTGDGCAEAGTKCTFGLRNTTVVVGACTPDLGRVAEGEVCTEEAVGHDCDVGLHCIGPLGGEGRCRRLCDIGGYEAPCPEGYRCTQAIATPRGPVNTYGLCIRNL